MEIENTDIKNTNNNDIKLKRASYCVFADRPNQTEIVFSKIYAMIGEEINIMCSSNSHPKPDFTIIHNGAIVSTEPVYTMSASQRSDAGQYICIARNKIGSHSVHGYL